ncbi:MAG: nickel-dependent hydrogenase large subunit [Lysobacterales bacterium]
MATLNTLLASGKNVGRHKPWPRCVINIATWREAARQLVDGALSMLGLWADADAVHLALSDADGTAVAVLSLPCPDGRFPSIGQYHYPAIRLERSIQDLLGFKAEGLSDTRPWLDHGRWGVQHPLGASVPVPENGLSYKFLAAEGESLHQIPVGPVHAGIIEPGHFRFSANGELVVRLEERLGYTHKGVEKLMAGADLATAASLAGRVSGDSTVAYAWTFARAVEAALGINVPERSLWIRALMAELERLANHLGDVGAICNDAAFTLLHAQCGVLREQVLRTSDSVFGHRLMMDRIVPGGVSTGIDDDGVQRVGEMIGVIRSQLPGLLELYDNTTSLEDRTVGTGIVGQELVRQFACGGFVGRASGRNFDTRKNLPYAPYDKLTFDVPVRTKGDVNARVWVRFDEIVQSLGLLEQIIGQLPEDLNIRTEIENHVFKDGAEGIALGEGFRGDILVWVAIDGEGRVKRCHLRDPSWFQWPLLEVAIKDNIVADFPLCNKSFNCSYSGHDL